MLIGGNPKRTLIRISVVVPLVLITFKWLLLPIRIQKESMEPTYGHGRINFINRMPLFFGDPERGDIVGIRFSRNAAQGTGKVLLLKRVIGLPGETVMIRNNRLFINELEMEEPYVKQVNQKFPWNYGPVEIEPEHYFLVGDNREMNQEDHSFGSRERQAIIGKILF